MLDPKKLLDRLPRIEVKDRPFRYLGRRVVQAMAEAATTNLIVGKRSAPGRYLVVRLVESEDEKDLWEQQFTESRPAILRELEREAAAHEIQPRTKLEVDLVVLTDREATKGEAERILSTVLDEDDIQAALERLQEERELILPLRVRTLILESEPAEAQVYLDHKPAGVTPCRIDDISEGEHIVTLVRPGYLPYEDTLRVVPGRTGQKLTYRADLTPEPPMGVVEVRTFPPRAQVTIHGETRESPADWRLPVGTVQVRVELESFEPQEFAVEVPSTGEGRPYRVQTRLRYNGPDQDEVVGRLIIYRTTDRVSETPEVAPVPPASPQPEPVPAANLISDFFGDQEEGSGDWPDWDLPAAPPMPGAAVQPAPAAAPPPPATSEVEILGERPVRRGVLLIGREDPHGGLVPDVKLFDPENSVSRGCHAWLYIYADRSTGAVYNTFLVGNNSPAGIRVDGALVMESRRLNDNSEVEIGNFRMRVVKEVPQARVEFGF